MLLNTDNIIKQSTFSLLLYFILINALSYESLMQHVTILEYNYMNNMIHIDIYF